MKKNLAYIFLLSVVFFSSVGFCGNLNIISLKYEPYPAQAGQYMDLWVSMRNDDTTFKINNIACEPVFEYPFSSEVNLSQSVPVLNPYQDVVVQFRRIRIASDAVEGWNKLKVKCSMDPIISVTKDMDIYVKSYIPTLVIGSIKADSLEILPDTENVKLSIELQNIGKGSAQMITSKLVMPNGFTATNSYSDTFNYGTISTDSSKTGDFYINIDKNTAPGRYNTTLKLQYKEENSNEFRNDDVRVELNIKETPIFEIEKVEILSDPDMKNLYSSEDQNIVIKSLLGQGQKASLKVFIKNIGIKEAKSTSLRIYKQADQPFDFEKKYDYIGDLQPNQTAEAILPFTVNDKAELKNYLLSAEIRYVQGNDVKTDSEMISIEVAKTKDSTMLVIFIIALFVAAAFAVWWKYVRKK